jgi:hypothetical protein
MVLTKVALASAQISALLSSVVESLSAISSQYFIGGMMPESANPVQQSNTVIENSAIPRRLAVF